MKVTGYAFDFHRVILPRRVLSQTRDNEVTLEPMRDLRKTLVISFSAFALIAATVGIYMAIHSPLFLVQVVEVSDQPDEAPVDAQTITQLAAIPAGIVNLFDLDLRPVERRILTNPWIREVRLQKRFPQTLSIAVSYRDPKALFQASDGGLAYVDIDGRIFGQVNLRLHSDLPLLTGIVQDVDRRVAEALVLIRGWERSPLGNSAELSSLHWDGERGFRALIVYPLGSASAQARGKSTAIPKVRAMVDLGQDFDAAAGARLDEQLQQLSRVVTYLGSNSIPVQQIWADSGKKIVVKTAHGS
ncbi:MAG: FtsQ-type POTRA domain-containing protein [Oligoflexia bacterium]|nr:FtsQ-type POTRA domain-containing protein [Oligoflexia bacterium]